MAAGYTDRHGTKLITAGIPDVKLRRLPEDFQVDEQTELAPSDGPFAIYRLTKRSLGTPEAIGVLVDAWNIPRKRISYAGLKDRHAVTTQIVTIHHGPRRHFQQRSLQLEYLGQVPRACSPQDIIGNRFQLVLRDMSTVEVQRAMTALEDVGRTGLPNYFDDQRFGSLGSSGEWIARAWCLGDYERAMWLALADAHPDDSSSEKKQKQILRDLWGRWPECKEALERSHRRSVVTYLSDKVAAGRPADYRGAFARISIDLRGLYLSAWQSALWNRMLTRWLEAAIDPAQCQPFELTSGRCVFFEGLLPETFASLCRTQLPLPSARLDLEAGPLLDLVTQVVAEEGLELRQLRVKYPRDSFFSKGSRQAAISLGQVEAGSADDELYPKRQKLTLSFSLPRGSYATILVKRLTQAGAGRP